MPERTKSIFDVIERVRVDVATDPVRIAWEDEMVKGYLDGRDPDNPEPNANRSHSYKHGFANGRDDLAHSPRATGAVLRRLAEQAIDADIKASSEHLFHQTCAFHAAPPVSVCPWRGGM
jgi:hypothetical protein